MSYSERAFAGPDYWGRTFQAEPCQHVAEWIEQKRLERLRRDAAEAIARRPDLQAEWTNAPEWHSEPALARRHLASLPNVAALHAEWEDGR